MGSKKQEVKMRTGVFLVPKELVLWKYFLAYGKTQGRVFHFTMPGPANDPVGDIENTDSDAFDHLVSTGIVKKSTTEDFLLVVHPNNIVVKELDGPRKEIWITAGVFGAIRHLQTERPEVTNKTKVEVVESLAVRFGISTSTLKAKLLAYRPGGYERREQLGILFREGQSWVITWAGLEPYTLRKKEDGSVFVAYTKGTRPPQTFLPQDLRILSVKDLVEAATILRRDITRLMARAEERKKQTERLLGSQRRLVEAAQRDLIVLAELTAE